MEEDPDPQEEAKARVPAHLHEYLHVFGEEQFAKLPPHCPYDCSIPLIEGKELHHGPIYPMTPAESRTLKEYIETELANRKIRASTSPAGAPVFFVKKADGTLRLVVNY